MLDASEPAPEIASYAYRSFDRQYILKDARLGDRCRPVLHRAHGDKQVYLTSLLTEVLGAGPAATAASAIPDLHHFRGSFGGKNVIPLWRNAEATEPNITSGLIKYVSQAQNAEITAEQLFAYAYGILAQPDYVRRFWDELELPPPRLPITKDAGLFQRVAEHGTRLLYLHTYGERFAGPNDDGSVPQREARCTKAVSSDKYPSDFSYNQTTEVLRVGDGEFSPVKPQVWEYSVSGLQVVKSWLDYRKLNRAGHKSSALDEIRPERWEFTEELLELLWVLEATVNLQPEGTALLKEVCTSDLFSRDEMPSPTEKERQPPRNAPEVQEELPAVESV